MRLKIATTLTFLLGIAMLFAWPFVVGQRPSADAGRKALAQFAARSLLYFGATCLVFLATALLAVFLMRQARRKYAEEALKNLNSLVEGSLRSHAQRDGDDATRG